MPTSPSHLNPAAPAFVPQPRCPSVDCPGENGFVVLHPEKLPYLQVADEDLFNPEVYPVSQADLEELIAIDQMNEFLAELELIEREEELHHLLGSKLTSRKPQESVAAAATKNVTKKHGHHSELVAANAKVKAELKRMKNNRLSSPKTTMRKNIQQPKTLR